MNTREHAEAYALICFYLLIDGLKVRFVCLYPFQEKFYFLKGILTKQKAKYTNLASRQFLVNFFHFNVYDSLLFIYVNQYDLLPI